MALYGRSRSQERGRSPYRRELPLKEPKLVIIKFDFKYSFDLKNTKSVFCIEIFRNQIIVGPYEVVQRADKDEQDLGPAHVHVLALAKGNVLTP